jgi:hypothetical protein
MKESESVELKKSLAELKDGLNSIVENPQATPRVTRPESRPE